MKKLLCLVFISTSLFAQNLKVEYNITVNKINDLASTTKSYTLEQTPFYSLFSINNIKDKKQFKHHEIANVIFDKDSVVGYIIGDDVVEFIYKEIYFKDFTKSALTYNFKTGYTLDGSIVQESLAIFDWEIEPSEDTIIAGYNCTKASTEFRGRQYIVYYTNEIANQGGPWKFDGLPGFILRVESLDGYLLIEPVKIILNTSHFDIKNPFLSKKTIPFEKIKDVILDQDKNVVKKMRSRPNPPETISIGDADLIEKLNMGVRVYE